MAKTNPYRFSSKYQDVESDFLYYGHRYYHSSIGRWLSRDLIEEREQANLYVLVRNDPLGFVDFLGLKNYKIGAATEPPMTFDEDFVFDSNIEPTAGDYLSWAWWGGMLRGAQLVRWDLKDANAAYSHYRDATGTDMEINYPKAYRDDLNVREGVNEEISAAQADAEKLSASSTEKAFTMTGDAERLPSPTTENWQKTIGQHYIWGSADVVDQCDGTFTMIITIREKDRWNFNRGAHDIATGKPDDANGRFVELGWAKSFTTNGRLLKKVTWQKGKVGSTTKIEDVSTK